MSFMEILRPVAFAILIAVFAIFRLDSRVVIITALAHLGATAIMLVAGNEELAERLAIYAFYFLASGVVLILIKLVSGAPERRYEWRLLALKLYNEVKQIKEWHRQEGAKTLVLDASVITKWFSEEENTGEALVIRERILDGKVKVIIPDLLLYEIAKALGDNPHFDDDDVSTAVQSVLDVGLEVIQLAPSLLKAAVRLVSRHKITLVEAIYVALSDKMGAILITADEGLYESTKQLQFIKLLGHSGEHRDIKE